MVIRQLNIEDRTYYFYNDLIKIKNFSSYNLKLGFGQWCLLYWLYNKKLQYNISSVNPLHLMINRIKDHFEEKDRDKYLIISSGNGDIMQKYQEVFDGIKEIIKKINIIANQ